MTTRQRSTTSRRATVVAAVLVITVIATACIPRDTAQITLDAEQTLSDFGATWELDYYVNDAYACGLSGNYSFMVMNPAGNPNAEAPLWVYLHGGGLGYYDEQGQYQTLTFQDENSWNHQETFQDLIRTVEARVLDGNGQPEDQTLVRRIQEGYRLLVVSMCDHDLYSGLGTPYANHPTNPNAEVNGLQATMAAIDYTAANYPTTHVWAHGTSAGSAGVWSLASSYGFEGTALTGVVADSTVLSPRYVEILDTYKGTPGWMFGADFETQGVIDKIGFFADTAVPADAESQIINRDFREVPVLFTGGGADPFCAGKFAPIPPAAAVGLGNCDYLFDGVRQAVADQPNSPHQVSLVPGAGHVPTLDPGPANDLVDAFIAEVLATDPPNFGS